MIEKQLSVLLVDDDEDTRNVFQLVMDHYHYHLAIAEDAETALAYLSDHQPDVIVMDIFLPGIDGYQALHQIRKNTLAPNCSVVATTAFYTHETQKELQAWGFSGYLPKPLKATELVPYLQQVIETDHKR